MKEKAAILKIYDEYVSEYMKPTSKYIKAARKFSESLEKLSEGLSEEKSKQLNQMYEDMNEMLDVQCKDAFVEGYCLASGLTLDSLGKERK